MKKIQPTGYQPGSAELGYQNQIPVDFSPGATQSATATTDFYEVGSYSTLRLVCAVASAGTGTLDLTVQTSGDNTNWYTAGTFAQKTGAATERKVFSVDRYVRVLATIGGGSPAFVYTLKGFVV